MAFKTDSGGMAFKCDKIELVTPDGELTFKCSDAKLSAGASTWATRISQLGKQTGFVRIITYSLPDMKYVQTQISRRPYDIHIIAHQQFLDRAKRLQSIFPRIEIRTHEEVHSKVLLIEPHTLWLSSANFGRSGWHESTIGIHSKEAHDYYVNKMFHPLWEQSSKVA